MILFCFILALPKLKYQLGLHDPWGKKAFKLLIWGFKIEKVVIRAPVYRRQKFKCLIKIQEIYRLDIKKLMTWYVLSL